MKKFFIVLMLSFLFVFLSYTQEKPFEGYNGFPWGTTVETIKKAYPAVIWLPAEAYDGSSKETNLYLVDTPVERFYQFFDNKLYSGRTVYTNPNKMTVDAIINKLVSSYGPVHSFSQDNMKAYWNLTPQLMVILVFEFGKTNTYMRIVYLNPVLETESKNYALKEKTNNLKM